MNSSLFTKAIAFTLAETLIVMGIIGVVAALTLPNLNNSTNDREKVAKVKKIYQNLNDALGRAEAVYGPYGEWFINDKDSSESRLRAGERFTEFMKVSKNCKLTKGCYESGSGVSHGYEFVLADGTAVQMGASPTGGGAKIDIDGLNKGPNEAGKDIFSFSLNATNNDGFVPSPGFKSFDTYLDYAKKKDDCGSLWSGSYGLGYTI